MRSNTLTGGWVNININQNEFESVSDVGNKRYNIVIPVIEGAYFNDTMCYRYGLRSENVGDEETYTTTYVFPCEYDFSEMQLRDFEGVVKVMQLEIEDKALIVGGDENLYRIMPENCGLISYLEAEFKSDLS